MQFDPKKRPQGFNAPTALPEDPEQAERWQKANRDFWENNPMSYNWREDSTARDLDAAFFDEIDQRFYGSVRHFMPWKSHPFELLIPFDRLGTLDVLEIGVGLGSHAELISRHARSYTGIDLTQRAVDSTTRRLNIRGLDARILRMDAEKMEFPDNSFDFIWSWGVIHHSSNTRKIVEQMYRVLRAGGKATVMVYHRGSMFMWLHAGIIRGVLMGEFLRGRQLHEVAQNLTDGAIARYYRPEEFRTLVSPCFTVDRFRIFGMKEELVPLPGGRLKSAVLKAVPGILSRAVMNTMGQGAMLVAEMTVNKPAS